MNASTASDVHVQLCPSCRADGGYGQAVEGVTYQCPACSVSWSPNPNLGSAKTPFGNWLQRLKVRLTSRF